MRTFFALALCGLTAAAADPKAPPANRAPVRELDVGDLKLDKVTAKTPVESRFRTAAEFAKWIDNKMWLAGMDNQVNFGAEQVVVFEWEGAPTDTLTATPNKAGDEVVFNYRMIPNDTSVAIHKVFVIPAKAKYVLKVVPN